MPRFTQTKYPQDLGFGTEFSTIALDLVPLLGVAGQLSLGASPGPFLLGRVDDWTCRYDLGFLLAMGCSLTSVTLVWTAPA